ncbi:uncharacterized protein A1O9_09015 [Exophiala aquamarina CBS 119918]|uniref:Uncharacterized protein n=1 Tax=Exophiala aquamarina CBS 119918 TaxID=1182545 RepID=A0A072P5L0_9EURO|nr:uncharacterized protein A1O9_09015 [Exophiala aquamarina CBS 119918]KEF54573.1 hypothetical protein A1O9_09015 [Exophiala aquamarina CBS 119918]
MATQGHSRKPSSRAALPRRTTRGPLDAIEDPLSISGSPSLTPSASIQATLPKRSQDEASQHLSNASPTGPLHTLPNQSAPSSKPQQEIVEEPVTEERDLSFLLDASIYHPLSQLEVPGPFRKPFLPPPTSETPIARSLDQLDNLLSQCEFLRAAHFAGMILTSGTVRPTDTRTVFRLLAIRYSCLELTGNLLFAAQEAKALEDLSSAFYYDDLNPQGGADNDNDPIRKVPRHIMPFSLRLQSLRLQSIGFSDSRRGVSTLYDTASECRENITSPATTLEQRKLWAARLQEVAIRVVNALVEIGDLDCAIRTLKTMKPTKPEDAPTWEARMILLLVKMGDVAKAGQIIKASNLQHTDRVALEALLAIAQGQYQDAEALLKPGPNIETSLQALVKQNLAVAYLYNGEVQKAKEILEDLVQDGHSFQTLTINLATIYDLSSDRSRELKASLVSRIASDGNSNKARAFTNADFKL